MGRSNAEPSLRISAGARLTVTAWREGKSKPQLRSAALNAFAAFLYGDIGQADDIEKALEHRAYVHFDFDEVGVNAEHGCAKRFEEHPKMPFAG